MCTQKPLKTDEAARLSIAVPDAFFHNHPSETYLSGLDEYTRIHDQSINDPDAFWASQSRSLLDFDTDFHTTRNGTFENGDMTWFDGGRLNASYNCIDRHALHNPDKAAIIFEADEPGHGHTITYRELLSQVCKVAHVLTTFGIVKGDCVTIYLPMIPEAAISMLACARIGAIHSVIFAGFSAESVRDRIIDSQSKVVITANAGTRGGKLLDFKRVVDEAVKGCPQVTRVLVHKNVPSHKVAWNAKLDMWWDDALYKAPNYVEPVSMASEDPLFLLYTSGSTGKPKGLVHSTAGYLVGAAMTGKYVFDIHPDDVFFCGGDVGWITGHTYAVYAPLVRGCTTVIFESTPIYPSPLRYWDVVQKYDVTQFYVAPTALRLLKRQLGVTIPKMNKLRVLGSVGEPIAPDVWQWYYEEVGGKEAYVTDTYWQTESGSHLIAPMAGIAPMKPGSACLPVFGIEPVILDPVSGLEMEGYGVEGLLAIRHPWPSMARTIWGARDRFRNTYLDPYKGYYFTGDGASRDKDGYIWILGRTDDVVNVSGHRLSTAEIEAALLEHSILPQ
ncbi:putative acetyl-coenzyme A synthetase [Aureobasidium sp. EXF-10727]|nr:putative acetyl-coenzyme A synthetase [Aureobasidium sp. EXF-10727]KAI4726044.1 putative acetyl-coenzyme A synthetase [Aureobasidium sp. EXF-10728]